MSAIRDVTDALEALMQQHDANIVPAMKDRGAAPAARSGQPIVSGQGGSGSSDAGVSYPLTETDYAARQWWPERSVTTTDGLFTIRFKPIKQITFTDATMQTITINYKGPP